MVASIWMALAAISVVRAGSTLKLPLNISEGSSSDGNSVSLFSSNLISLNQNIRTGFYMIKDDYPIANLSSIIINWPSITADLESPRPSTIHLTFNAGYPVKGNEITIDNIPGKWGRWGMPNLSYRPTPLHKFTFDFAKLPYTLVDAERKVREVAGDTPWSHMEIYVPIHHNLPLTEVCYFFRMHRHFPRKPWIMIGNGTYYELSENSKAEFRSAGPEQNSTSPCVRSQDSPSDECSTS